MGGSMGLEPLPTKVLVSYQRQGPLRFAEGLLPVSPLTSWGHLITCDDFMRLLLFWKDHCMENKEDCSSLLALPITGQVRTGCRSLPFGGLTFLICKRVRAIPDLSSSRHSWPLQKPPNSNLATPVSKIFGDKSPDSLFGQSSQRGCYELILSDLLTFKSEN